jgi:hypothetical protein
MTKLTFVTVSIGLISETMVSAARDLCSQPFTRFDNNSLTRVGTWNARNVFEDARKVRSDCYNSN